MKKIILFAILFAFTVKIGYCADDYNMCLDKIKLKEKQKIQIQNIEKEYKKELTSLRGDIILKNMQIAQLKPHKKNDRILGLKAELKDIEEEIEAKEDQKQDDIISCLGFFQKFKYRRCLNCL